MRLNFIRPFKNIRQRAGMSMLGIHELIGTGSDAVTARPLCPNCGRPMHVSRTTKSTGGQSALRTYGCGECGVWVTEATNDIT